jgi:dihydroneopterin aldolase
MSDAIIIDELEVFFHVGVPDEERVNPQRLLISVEMKVDTTAAAEGDDLSRTIDYYAVVCQLRGLGIGREWKLIETLAGDVADLILEHPVVSSVTVEISKFIVPDARRVAVRIDRTR